MHPHDHYGEPLPSLPAIPAPPPPRKDPVRPWLFAALGVFLVVAIALATIILWPADGEKSAGTTSSASASGEGSGGASSSASGDQFTAAPNPGATDEPSTDEPSATEPSTNEPSTDEPGSTSAPPPTTNGVSDQQRVAACQLAADGEGNRVSRDPEWGTSSGASVEALTTLLAYLGYDIAPADYYSPEAEQVAMGFQSDSGLVADGIFGPMSWSVLHQTACG